MNIKLFEVNDFPFRSRKIKIIIHLIDFFSRYNEGFCSKVLSPMVHF